jgi:hypothetical protein
MNLTVILNLRFDHSLLFNGFLPESEEDKIEVGLIDGKYQIIIFLSDRNKQLRWSRLFRQKNGLV